MPRLEFFTVCGSGHKVSDPEETVRTDILTDFFPAMFPDALAKATVISSWKLTAKDKAQDWQATLVVKSPGRDGTSFSLSLSNSVRRYQHIREILGIPVDEAGVLLFEMLLNGKTVATHAVTIHAP
jgi:hypothetical protein